MCILCTPQPIYQSTYWPTVNWCISRYIDRQSTDVSADIIIDWDSTDMSIDISTDTRRYIDQDMSVDVSVECHPTLNWYVSRYRSTESGCLIVSWHVDQEAIDISSILHWYLATGVDCSLHLSQIVFRLVRQSKWNFLVASITKFNRTNQTPCIWISLTTKISLLTRN